MTVRPVFWKSKHAFTMVEILIATGLLALFMSSIFLLFRSGSDSFRAGSWRIENQQRLQRFLVALRDVIEKANYAQVIRANGNVANPTIIPVYVKKAFHNSTGSCRTVSCEVLFSAITEPYREGQADLGSPDKNGAWSGVALYCQKGKLVLKRQGDWDKLNLPYGAPAGLRPDLGLFPAKAGADFQMELGDVQNVRIDVSRPSAAEPEVVHSTITFTINMQRYVNGKATEAKISKSIVAKLLERDHRVEEIP